MSDSYIDNFSYADMTDILKFPLLIKTNGIWETSVFTYTTLTHMCNMFQSFFFSMRWRLLCSIESSSVVYF